MRNKKRILISIVALALVGWISNSIFARSQFGSDTAAVRFFDHDGECQVEVINRVPFTLTVFDAEQELAYQSRLDPLSFCHSVEISLSSAFVDGRSTDWSEKLIGMDYQAMQTADPIRFRVTPMTN